MTTSVIAPPTATPVVPDHAVEDAGHLCIHGVTWDAFELALQALDGQRLRVTYDRGSLELMVLSYLHEQGKSRLRKMVDVLAEELDVEIESLGSTTCRRRESERGIEPDECWYIPHAVEMRGRRTLDFEVDPPPDLALEIEVSRTVIDRLSVYQALRVPEIWRSDGRSVRILVFDEEGQYREVEESGMLPGIRASELARFLAMANDEGELRMIREFRAWVIETFRGGN